MSELFRHQMRMLGEEHKQKMKEAPNFMQQSEKAMKGNIPTTATQAVEALKELNKTLEKNLVTTNLHLDNELIQNKKERLRQEAYLLLRHACSINEASIVLGNSYIAALQVDRDKIPARVQAAKLFSKSLQEQADKVMKDACDRFIFYVMEE